MFDGLQPLGSAEIDVGKVGSPGHRLSEVGVAEVGPAEDRQVECHPAEDRPTKFRPGQICRAEGGSCELRLA